MPGRKSSNPTSANYYSPEAFKRRMAQQNKKKNPAVSSITADESKDPNTGESRLSTTQVKKKTG